MKYKVGLSMEGQFPSGNDKQWYEVTEEQYDAVVEIITPTVKP